MPVDKNKTKLTFHQPENADENSGLPMITHGVSAGFPSPALDFMEYKIDLNKYVSKNNPHATFYIKVAGNSMINAGIDDGDILVVDRSLEPADNCIAICYLDGEFTVKRLKVDKSGLRLMPENPAYQPITITEDNQFILWGIVTYVLKSLK